MNKLEKKGYTKETFFKVERSLSPKKKVEVIKKIKTFSRKQKRIHPKKQTKTQVIQPKKQAKEIELNHVYLKY